MHPRQSMLEGTIPVSYKLKLLKPLRSNRQAIIRGMPESQFKWLGRGRYGRMRLGSNKKHFSVGWRSIC